MPDTARVCRTCQHWQRFPKGNGKGKCWDPAPHLTSTEDITTSYTTCPHWAERIKETL